MARQKEGGFRVIFRLMFNRRWWWVTLLILAAAAVCVRLGIWQLDRLAEQRAFHAHVREVQSMPPLNFPLPAPVDLSTMEYRPATAMGTYDFPDQVAIRDQYNDVQPGYHLLTPLKLADGEAVLVDRGWIPSAGNSSPQDWRQYDQAGEVRVNGILRLEQAEPSLGAQPDPALAPGQTRLDFWIFVNLNRIGQQIPLPVLPVYIERVPDPSIISPPLPILQPLDLSDGGQNLSYAVQWFSFSILGIVGYDYFLWRKEIRKRV